MANFLTVRDVVDVLGGTRKAARAFRVSDSAVSHWMRRNKIPPEKAIQIEILTLGQFKAAELLKIGR